MKILIFPICVWNTCFHGKEYRMTVRNGCPSELTGEQCEWIEPLIGPFWRGGHFRKVAMRMIFKAISDVIGNCCSWRMLPGPKDTLTEYH